MPKSKRKHDDRRKTGEELQKFLAFRRRGFAVPSRKGKGSYDRRKFKKGAD